jgi:serine/threonine protein kinase
MLLKEMEVLMLLNHPNIVGCLGLEHLDDYVYSEGQKISVGECIVLEYVDGETLSQALEQGVLADASSCQHIIDELLEALAYMHASSVTHRDLKPSNIMLTRNGQHAKLIDFSLADTDSHAYLKQPSGTLQYMAPEQATGSIPDVRNDIYSLCVIIRQLPLKGYWKDVSRRCLLPIDQRYPNIAALQEDIAARRQRATRRRQATFIAVPLLLLALFSFVLWHQFSSRQDTIYNELNRVPTITAQALSALDKQIAATNLNRQMDTISHWRYLDPKINEKILSVNAFAYDYALDSLSDLTDADRLKVLQTMLDHWQRWHDNIVHRAKYLMRIKETVVSHYAEQSVSPGSSSVAR